MTAVALVLTNSHCLICDAIHVCLLSKNSNLTRNVGKSFSVLGGMIESRISFIFLLKLLFYSATHSGRPNGKIKILANMLMP